MSPAEAAIREAMARLDPPEEFDKSQGWTGTRDAWSQFDLACHPIRTSALLNELDALRARCEAGEALLRKIRHDDFMHDSLRAEIDAHLKGAGRE